MGEQDRPSRRRRCRAGRRWWSSIPGAGAFSPLLPPLLTSSSTTAAATGSVAFAAGPKRPQWVDVKPRPIPRIDARDFVGRREAFEALALESPLILTHAFDEDTDTGGGSGRQKLRRFATDEAFSDRFFDAFASATCSYQRKGNARGAKPRIYEGPLAEIVGGMMTASHHGDAWYLLSEDLLDAAPKGDAALRSPLTLPPSLFGAHDYFDLFPKAVQPKKSCVILGGPGARSFLHADPYEWTGVNYLFEGEKLWTFVRPGPENEAALRLERTKPDAWGAEVGAGWKSDAVDLYHVEPRVQRGGEKGVDGGVTLGLPPALAEALRGGGEDVLAGVQGEGELVVIPPRWAHQVYHLSPALALAWQVCNRANLRRVLRHVLDYCAEESSSKGGKAGAVDGAAAAAAVLEEVMGGGNGSGGGGGGPPGVEAEEELAWARGRIEAALARALEIRYGKEKGAREWARLKEAAGGTEGGGGGG